MVFSASPATNAGDIHVASISVMPAPMSPQLRPALRGSFAGPTLTNDLLAAYVARQQALKSFSTFTPPPTELTEEVLLGYIARTKPNMALAAIDNFAIQPALNDAVLQTYATKSFIPTVKKLKIANSERLCLTQAIYHEARGESEKGQWAVANVIINRAMSKKYPASLCGVVFQNADQGFHKCQFTFACDGKSDMGTERRAWNRAMRLASAAYDEFRQGERPGVIPGNALFYHTIAVAPTWSTKFRRVATIGSHIFYAAN
jgi:spore germination cell wall hydrolase CwlJ-like protein